MLNWEKIYELNNKNNKKAGTYFEKLILAYLSCVYSKYSWKNTKSSWDGNKDFISLILDNIWAEAKYKKDSSALEKKDVDLTILSGFLDGKIKLVFIITNGYVPPTISTRVNEAGEKCGFTVVCITKIQLEYWLIAHPAQYKKYFQEPLPNVCQLEAISIEEARLENQLDANFESSYIQPEFVIDSICSLCVTFSCNTDLKCTIVEKEEYPFCFIESPEIVLSPGIQQKKFLVKLTQVNNGPVVLEYKKSNGISLFYAIDIKIVDDPNPKLIYSQQEAIKIKLCQTINTLPNANRNHIIAIHGAIGDGKTFLMKEMAKDLSFSHVVAILQCEESACLGINSMKLCQMIMYFNYGDIYQSSQDYNNESRDYYKYLLINNNSIIEKDLLIDIFDGCFDCIIAHNVINRLSKENPTIIKKSQFARKHILFLDDVVLFSEEELNVFRMIFHQLKNSCNNSILIFSSTVALFDKAEITPYKLNGLSLDDIKECLKYNLNKWQYTAFTSIIPQMPRHPEMISELICFIKNNSVTNTSSIDVNHYINNLRNNNLTNIKFNLTDEENVVLDLIFNFSKGIDQTLLLAVNIDKDVLKSLCDKGYIQYYKQRYFPCVDYFQYAYKNQKESVFFADRLSEYLCRLLDKSNIDPLFDVFQAQSLLIQCDYKQYLKIKATYKAQMIDYINTGCYKAAMLYGEIFCFDILNNTPQHQKADLEALFYYGISLIHCDAQRRAIEIFDYIKNHAEKNTLSYFKASSELLNNKYSRFQINDIIPKAIVLKRDIYTALSKVEDENCIEANQLRVAYSTCMNRMMMIYFLKDNLEKATKLYDEFYRYHSILPQCAFSDKYNSMLLEWKMDYARGIAIYNLQKSITLENECSNCFSEEIDFRRKILCEIDKLFFKAIQNKDYDDTISALINYKEIFESKGILSESMKTSIRISYCYLMKYACIPEFDDITLLAPFVDEIYTEIFSAQLESHIITQGRTAYLLSNLLAILYIIKNDFDKASQMLQYSMNLIQNCGESYRQIAEHNYAHLKNIKKVRWYFYEDKMCNEIYYLDLRVW